MRYIRGRLIEEIDTGREDELGNKIYELEYIDVVCRTTEWTSDDVALYGRTVTEGNRKVIFKPLGISMLNIVGIELEGQSYNIHSIVNLNRWIMLIVKGRRI